MEWDGNGRGKEGEDGVEMEEVETYGREFDGIDAAGRGMEERGWEGERRENVEREWRTRRKFGRQGWEGERKKNIDRKVGVGIK